MELNSIGKVCSEIIQGEKYYAYNRVSTYDPNMCSTARFSPPYNSDQVSPDQGADAYENVILIPCSTTSNEAHCVERSAISSNEISVTYAAPGASRAFTNDYATSHQSYATVHQNSAESQEKEHYEADHLEPQIAQIVLRQSPNGTLYQNYYVTNSVKVGLIPNSESNPYRTNFITADKENEHLPQEGYNYHNKIVRNGEIMEHLAAEANFVQLQHGLIAEQNQEEYLTESYNTIPTSNTSMALHDKDPQRLLLESTMSPLLAAVNNITQRDAELQSYFNQTLGKDNDLGFDRDPRYREQRDEYADPSYSKSGEEEATGTLRDYLQENDSEDFLLVADKPVESRAKASLPTQYLYFACSSDKLTDISVYAKREIPLRTKFGPFEGELRLSTDVISDVILIQASNMYPLLLMNNTNILDVSNENSCNWMRFVRLAKNFTEQNLLLFEESGKLYFKSCQVIHPKQELKVGYSVAYAKHFDLRVIGPTEDELREIYDREHPWPCYECDDRFSSSKDLQQHLSVHDVDDELVKRKVRRKKKKIHNKHLVDIRKHSIRCIYCNKVFMTSSSLKKHINSHLSGRRNYRTNDCISKTFRCGVCYRKFATEEKLKAHRLAHVKSDAKLYKCTRCKRSCSTPTALSAHMSSHSHSLRYFSCIYCSEKFVNVSEFRHHITVHSVNGVYLCQWCNKKFSEYHLVRNHVRVFHQSFKHSCDECGRKFPNTSFLRRHKLCHSEKFEYLCSQCGKQFKRKDKLREHILRGHSEKRRQRLNKNKAAVVAPATISMEDSTDENSPHYEWNSPQYVVRHEQCNVPLKSVEDYRNFMYKCDECMLGFKRRGMLVNHMVKRHPDVPIESIPELNLPILKPQSLFYCQYCSKVYKSNAKRKLHILKNHPGQELPPSARTVTEPSQINARTVGNYPIEPHRCHWCYKQYAARNRLVAHHRKAHPELEFVATTFNQSRDYLDTAPTSMISRSPLPSSLEPPIDVYRPPCSPENKLLKLSSAALELSSIEDRKFFDFLNEKSQCSLQEQTSLPETDPHGNLNLDDNGSSFSKVDVNFKVVESEFGESSSNGELNRLPQLFEESITCI